MSKSQNDKFKKHDPTIWELLKQVGDNFVKFPEYVGINDRIKRTLAVAGGGLILKYTNKCLYVYRLCQARIFVKSHYHDKPKKVERCCKNHPTESVHAFSYHKFINDLQNSDEEAEKHSLTKVTIGSDDICIKILPVVANNLYNACKERPDEGSIMSAAGSIDGLSMSLSRTNL